MEQIIRTEKLSVYYGKHRGIDNLDLVVNQGEVYGFLGPNGAGKTTTQRVLLDVLRPTTGRACIFGLDCQKDGVVIRRRIGYLPGELSMYGGMRGNQFLDMVETLRGGKTAPGYRKSLVDRLMLDPTRKIREYSRGNKQKIGLVAAFISKPDLLILDEPTTGLDPLVQQTTLDLVREARQENRTVFFSSHILSEVQAVCDRVGIIREGQLVATERVEVLTHRQFVRLRLVFEQAPPPDVFALEGVQVVQHTGKEVLLEVRQQLNEVLVIATRYQVLEIETPPVTLEEVFLAHYGSQAGGSHA